MSAEAELRSKLVHYLRDILEYGERAFKKLDGVGLAAFVDDLDALDAVYYRMQCVSEAVET